MASIVFDSRRGTYQVQWSNGIRWVRETVYRLERHKPGDARPKRDPLEVTRALAAFKERERAARRGRRFDVGQPLEAFLADYRIRYRAAHADASLEQLEQAHRNFLEWTAAHGVKRLEAVTPTTCSRYLETRAGQVSRKTGRGITHATLKKERALLGGAWAVAVRLEQLERNPWRATTLPAKPRAAPKGSWTPDEYAKLLEVSRPWLRDVIALGCHTGLRISALLNLEFSHIHGDGRGERWSVLEVPQELDKAGKGYKLPVHPVVREILERRWRHREPKQARVITAMRGQPIKRGDTTQHAICRACARAGLPKPSMPNHQLRRTFGRWAVMGHLTGRPVPVYIVSRWMGHSSIATTLIYLDIKQDESSDWMSPVSPNESLGHSPALQ